MCFRWLRRIYHFLRGRCARRNRGYNNEISSHHRRFCNNRGGFSNLEGHGSFSCDGEGSVIYSRGPSSWQPMPTSTTYDISGGYRCGGEGSVVITRGDGEGTSGWGIAGGTVPVYGSGRGMGCSSEDSGHNPFSSSGGGGGSITVGGGSAYGYDASLGEKPLTAGGGSGGSGYYSGGVGYGVGGYSGPELSYGGGDFSQTTQQKCPVVVPNIEAHQSKQISHWPPARRSD